MPGWKPADILYRQIEFVINPPHQVPWRSIGNSAFIFLHGRVREVKAGGEAVQIISLGHIVQCSIASGNEDQHEFRPVGKILPVDKF